MRNRSPWLHQLDKDRPRARLRRDLQTDVALVGAGIAGMATAFFTLKYTDKKVTVLEAYKLAHGATGHNAGQIVSYFEKGFAAMVKEFGMPLAAEGQRSIDEAWSLLQEIYDDAKLDIFFDHRTGHDGFSTYEQVINALEEARYKREAHLTFDRVTIATSAPFVDDIPHQYAGLWSAAPQRQILEMLETDNLMFVAAGSTKKGCTNSALLCERLVDYLYEAYPERFALYEHAPVRKIILKEGSVVLDADMHVVDALNVVLCTNGFENLHIINEHGLEIDAKYHANVRGRVAYMSAYLEEAGKPPVATAYQTPEQPIENLPYYYLTRRPFEYEEGKEHSLISVGGPEEAFEQAVYSREAEYPESAMQVIDTFVRTIYDSGHEGPVQYIFTWHGLMGYTANGIRMVGPEPQNPVLLYNLGCNGVGILPSIFGGRKLARHLAGEQVQPSIFDIPKRIASSVQVPATERAA
jgi:glycine/D-amino acid oxidase-like deaminating enzyme